MGGKEEHAQGQGLSLLVHITLANILDCFHFIPLKLGAQVFADFFEHGIGNILLYLRLSSNVASFLYMIISTLNFKTRNETPTRKYKQFLGKAR